MHSARRPSHCSPWAQSLDLIVFARLSDRVGKGIRGAPRVALVADLAPPELRGAAFGLRQSLDTAGAFSGPLLAVGLMLLFANDFRLVFWVATVPAGGFCSVHADPAAAALPPRGTTGRVTRMTSAAASHAPAASYERKPRCSSACRRLRRTRSSSERGPKAGLSYGAGSSLAKRRSATNSRLAAS